MQQAAGSSNVAAPAGEVADDAASADQLLVAQSGLFDAEFYLARNPDVQRAGCDPLQHFLQSGWREDRNPNAYFSVAHYRRLVPEAAQIQGGPLLHYLRGGEAAGCRPVPEFDPVWYRATYRVPHTMPALAHFLAHRHGGKVSPNPAFDAAYYSRANQDVAAAGHDPFEHYRERGRAEFRLPRPALVLLRESGLFDADFYLLRNPDIREQDDDPLIHYFAAGEAEGRAPNVYFNPAWYTARHLDATAALRGPLIHYVVMGEAAGLRPSLAFDPVWYRRAYDLPSETPALAHWLAHRRLQRFSPLPLFDPAFYMARYGAQIGPNRDPFAHYLATGAALDFDPNPYFSTAAYRRTRMTEPAAGSWPELANPLLHFIDQVMIAS